MTPRLSDTDIARVRAAHSIVDVLSRLGVDPPARWNGAADYMISCPCPGHADSTPSCTVHPQTDRWHCFGCGARGDVLELVRHVEGVTSLRTIAEILDSRRPLTPAAMNDPSAARPVAAGTSIASAERPDPARTSYQRVMAANAEAWRYLSLPKLARRGRDCLRQRGIDVTALEGETRQPVVGHTPYQPDGLVTHLRARGFSDDEIVDAGWGARRDGQQLIDRFRRRVIIPVRDQHGHVLGVYGRDVTGTASQKYLNTAETVAFHKGAAVYRPSVTPLDQHATVIVCEGSMDALAIAACAASVGKSRYFAPASPSGTALTDTQAALVLAISARPPLVCADGDEPGIAASEKWVRTLMAHARETVVTVLPDGHDPASWLREHGAAGLCAFTRKGCLDLAADAVKPTPAGGLLADRILAEQIADARRRDPDTETVVVIPEVIRRLAAEVVKVPGEAARQRFAAAAGAALARGADGMDSDGRAQQVLTAGRGQQGRIGAGAQAHAAGRGAVALR
jgi:DNA primase